MDDSKTIPGPLATAAGKDGCSGTAGRPFIQHLDDPKLAGDTGPGWEYYLDVLVAAREGSPMPSFDEYYAAQRDHYLQPAN